MTDPDAHSPHADASPLHGYYRWHSKIYDATRWSFLFGRSLLIKRVAELHLAPKRILDVGCGTGKNLRDLARAFPDAQLHGLDLSSDMLAVAEKNLHPHAGRITFHNRPYDAPLEGQAFDLVVFSYALTMFNPGWEQAIANAHDDLRRDGHVGVVDFHDTGVGLFRAWMRVNHVRMEAHLPHQLQALFSPVVQDVRKAYLGLWRYLVFVGAKAEPADV